MSGRCAAGNRLQSSGFQRQSESGDDVLAVQRVRSAELCPRSVLSVHRRGAAARVNRPHQSDTGFEIIAHALHPAWFAPAAQLDLDSEMHARVAQ